MNGSVTVHQSIGDDFTPAARLNSQASSIATVTVSENADVNVYSAEEARRYAAAFTRAAELLDEQAVNARQEAGR